MATERIGIPSLMIQGAKAGAMPRASIEGEDGHFTGGYRRVLPQGVGHFRRARHRTLLLKP